jgi:hypothetical protein
MNSEDLETKLRAQAGSLREQTGAALWPGVELANLAPLEGAGR